MRRTAGGDIAAALAPQPVAHFGRVLAVVLGVGPGTAVVGGTADIAGQVATGTDPQVAPRLRVPGAVQAGAAAIDELLEVTARVIEHRGSRSQGPWLVVGIAGRRRRGGSTGGIDPVQRVHAQVAGTEQFKVAGAGADHAEAAAGRRCAIGLAVQGHAEGGRLFTEGRDGRLPQVQQELLIDRIAGLDHHPGARQLVHRQLGPGVAGLDRAIGRAVGTELLDRGLPQIHQQLFVDRIAGLDHYPYAGQVIHRHLGPGPHHLAGQFLGEHPVMAVRQMQVTAAWVGLHDAAVGCAGIGPGHQAQGPGLRAFGKHRCNGPELALAPDVFGPQLHRVDAARQLDVGAGRDQPALGQGLAAVEHDDVVVHIGQVYLRQRHALGPGHGPQLGALGQQRPGLQTGAGDQGPGLAEQGAGGEQQVARGIANRRRQYRTRRQYQGLVQGRRDRQARARGHGQPLDRQVVVEGTARREGGAVGQGHAVARHDDSATGEVHARQQHPALVVHGGRRRREAVVDAAIDIQVAPGAQGQAADLAGTVDRGLLAVGVEAGIAIARQVQVALHHQVAVCALADDLDPGPQMEGVGIAGVVQAGQLVLQQVAVLQGRVDKGRALGMLGIQVGLGDFLVRAAAGGGVGFFRSIVVAEHAVDRNRARALDIQRAAGIDVDVVAALVRLDEARRVQLQGAAAATVVLPRSAAHSHVGAVAQVDARTVGQGQAALARAEHHAGAVR